MMSRPRAIPVLTVLGLLGCHPPSREQWERVFTARDGTARLITLSTDDLFAGWGTYTEKALPTHAPCKGAWYDHPSGRLATVEDAGNGGEVVRVYSAEGEVLSTYKVDPDLLGQVCHSPCLSDGGRRVAFMGDLGAVFWADVGEDPDGDVRKLWQLWGTRADESRYGRHHWSLFARCDWIDESSLAVCCPAVKPGPRPIYRVDLEADKIRPLSNGHLAGVLADSTIVATTYYSYGSRYPMENAASGATLGTARVGHSYCKFKGISSSGEYILYHEPGGGTAING